MSQASTLSSLKETSPVVKEKGKGRGKTKQRLIDTGLELFASRGFEGVTVSELEEAVGLKAGSGSFYRHFADKKELLSAIIEQEIVDAKNRRNLELDALSNVSEDIREALKQQFKLTLKGLQQNQKALDLFTREKEQYPELFKLMRTELVDNAQLTVIEHYTQRIASGDMIKIDPIQLTTVVQSALFGFHQGKNLFAQPMDKDFEDAFIETLLDLVII